MLAICPDFIPPRFDKYSSLQESDLKTKIDKLAAEFNLPLKRLYVRHGLKFEIKQNNAMTQKIPKIGSKRSTSIVSTHSNAYIYGFWKNKRIALSDTLLDSHINDLLRFAKNEEAKKDSAEENSVGETAQETNGLLQSFRHFK